tara:strand:+ start:98 stop:241 length:144 start_codon:yes stop_codon:yes gene_type:complete
MDIKAEIKNGRLKIESTTDKGSEQLDRWIEGNKRHLSNFLDIEILAH